MTPLPVHRVGLGTDIHRLESGGPLRLGGIDVPFDKHFTAHSDGDVVLHAVIDAVLGAAGLPDIGDHFPDTDPQFKGADSRLLLTWVVEEIHDLGYAVVNVDVTINAERPKLSAFKQEIRNVIAVMCEVMPDCVNVKAKTNEGMDAVGRGEAIACTAIVGLSKLP
ncbi:MAG TPA: 2-C-methyl-D-erythritol 2,4-cyclodiphosphate synthase [Phycisphaerae bacterium]|nr:2-C-methyl-D-erythritol 2,4-cyclodiphosphate synthase [Phycisphaerae bacterium]